MKLLPVFDKIAGVAGFENFTYTYVEVHERILVLVKT